MIEPKIIVIPEKNEKYKDRYLIIYDNKDKYNIRVVCMSFGSPPLDKNDPLVLGAEALWDIGVVVVAAAGNSGPEKV